MLRIAPERRQIPAKPFPHPPVRAYIDPVINKKPTTALARIPQKWVPVLRLEYAQKKSTGSDVIGVR
jgi:hypothetical protein